MKKLVAFMHVSLDGFVAGKQGEMDWIHVDDEIFAYVDVLTKEADTALYGRVTYNMMEGYWPIADQQPNATAHDKRHAAWYRSIPKIVVSNTLSSNSEKKLTVIGKDLAKEINQLKQGPGSNILIFGRPSTTHALMELDAIDEYWLFLNPVLRGEGIPLFKNIKHQVNLQQISCKVFSSGVNALHYRKK